MSELSADRDSLQCKVDELSRENATLKNLIQEMEGRNKEFRNQVVAFTFYLLILIRFPLF